MRPMSESHPSLVGAVYLRVCGKTQCLFVGLCKCVGKAIVLVSRRFRIKVEADGREYLVLRKAYDMRESAEREAARLSAETGEEYKVVEA
jgi:hypothetical protein